MFLRDVAFIAVAGIVATACGGPDTEIVSDNTPGPFLPHFSPTPMTTPPPEVKPLDLTVVDTSKHSVPLDRIIFDTFNLGPLPFSLPQGTDEMITQLRDLIPPLNNPDYVNVDAIDFLDPQDLVLGYNAGDQWYAYPFQILNFHEFVNETLGGVPILISYCPLCRSGIVFDRRVDGETLSFGNTSALYESNAVAYDRETGSYWFQVKGEAIVGPLTGKRLKPLPSITLTWEEWKKEHPGSLVLSPNTGYKRPYEFDSFAGFENLINDGRFAFPVSRATLDARLSSGAHVLVVTIDDEAKAYPIDELGDSAVIDSVGGQEVVVFSKASGPSAAAFRRNLDGQLLSFELKNGHFIDKETGSTWNLSGQAVAGELQGASLEPVATLFSFWFAAAIAHPGLAIYLDEGM